MSTTCMDGWRIRNMIFLDMSLRLSHNASIGLLVSFVISPLLAHDPLTY